MRELKFRARATKDHNGITERYYVYSDKFKCLHQFFFECEEEGWKYFEQFTGLKDKNGKEIYEWDICRYSFGNGHWVSVVKFYIGKASFVLECNGDYCLFERVKNVQDDFSNTNVEVIGNIYENPELIKGA